MELGIVGAGYVGLVAGACLASTGNRVVVADRDESTIERLRSGKLPIHEPGLQPLLEENVAAGRLSFTTDTRAAAARSQVVFLAVGTPGLPDGGVDLSGLREAAQQVGAALQPGALVAVKSTVPVGTHRQLVGLLRAAAGRDVAVVVNPEFLKEGTAVADFLRPSRVVLGGDDERALTVLRRLYAPFMRRNERILVMDPASAELTKYAANAMLAARVAFVNDLARLCHAVGADITAVRHGLGTDPRIGSEFLYPSLGYGGSCFPKDVAALAAQGERLGVDLHLVRGTHRSNADHFRWVLSRIRSEFPDGFSGKRIAVWGLAFKANTDDVRNSPAIALVKALAAEGAHVLAYDPHASDRARSELAGLEVSFCRDPYATALGADALVVCTEWTELRNPDLPRVAAEMRRKVVFDGRNLYDPGTMAELGFRYHSVGRPTVGPLSAPLADGSLRARLPGPGAPADGLS